MKQQHSAYHHPRRGIQAAKLGSLAAAVLLAFSGSAGAASFQLPGSSTTLDVGGYAKVDVIWNDEANGDNSQTNIEYLPALIPLKNPAAGEDGQIVFNGRESRIWIKTSTPGAAGDIKTHIELDFDTNEGNQGISNSHGARVRHAYGTYNGMLFGRTWSTFMYLPGLPETNDFGGPTGDIFVRQAMVRFTWPMAGGSIDLAIENPETSLDTIGQSTNGGLVDDDKTPDIIGRYNTKNWSVAALVRNLNVEKGAVDGSTTSVALQFGWNYQFGGGVKFQGMVTAGEGFGRYMLMTHPDAVVTGSTIDALEVIGGFASLQFKTGGTGRINLVLGTTSADDPAALVASSGATTIEKTSSVHVNYMWNPEKSIRHGIELINATAESYTGVERELTRIQWSTRVMF